MSQEDQITIGYGERWVYLPATATDYEVAVAISDFIRRFKATPDVRRPGPPRKPFRWTIEFSNHDLFWIREPLSVGSVMIRPGKTPAAGIITEGDIELDGDFTGKWGIRVYTEGVVSVLRGGVLHALGAWNGHRICDLVTSEPIAGLPPEIERIVLARLVAAVRTHADDIGVAPEDPAVATRLREVFEGDLLIPYVGLRIVDDHGAIRRGAVEVEMRPYIGHGDFGFALPAGSRNPYRFALPIAEAFAAFGHDLVYLRLGAEPAVHTDRVRDQMLCERHGHRFGVTTPPVVEADPPPCSWCVSRINTGVHPMAGPAGVAKATA